MVCVNNIGSFTCVEDPQSEPDAEPDAEMCASAPCQNGGTCAEAEVEGSASYTCECVARFSGANCEVDECGTVNGAQAGLIIGSSMCAGMGCHAYMGCWYDRDGPEGFEYQADFGAHPSVAPRVYPSVAPRVYPSVAPRVYPSVPAVLNQLGSGSQAIWLIRSRWTHAFTTAISPTKDTSL